MIIKIIMMPNLHTPNFIKKYYPKLTEYWKIFFPFFLISAGLTVGILGIFSPFSPVLAAPLNVTAQIRLRDAAGIPFTSSTVVRFNAYGVTARTITTSTLDTAPLIWQETYDGRNASCPLIHPDGQGNFSVNLGSCTPFPTSYKASLVVINIKVWPEPGRALNYDVMLDEAGASGLPNSSWIHGRFLPLQALRGFVQLSLKTKEVQVTDDTAVPPTDFTLASTSSPTTTIPENVTAALLSLESRLSAVTSSFLLSSPSSTLDFLQNTAIPTLSVGNLTVTESPLFKGNLVVQGTVGFGVDTIGQAEIVTGGREVRVVFSESYPRLPIIVATPSDYDGLWKLGSVSTTGFTISIPTTSIQDIVFNWHAFSPTSSMQVVVGEREDALVHSSSTIEVSVPISPPPVRVVVEEEVPSSTISATSSSGDTPTTTVTVVSSTPETSSSTDIFVSPTSNTPDSVPSTPVVVEPTTNPNNLPPEPEPVEKPLEPVSLPSPEAGEAPAGTP